MIAALRPQPPAWLADQYGAARDEARGLHDRIGTLLPIFERPVRSLVPPLTGRPARRGPGLPARSACWPAWPTRAATSDAAVPGRAGAAAPAPDRVHLLRGDHPPAADGAG